MKSEESKVEELWRDLRKIANIDMYTDGEWCEDLSYDAYFAYVLTWAAWRPERQAQEWDRVRSALSGRTLTEIGDGEVLFSLPWQNEWLARVVKFLRSKEMTTEGFVGSLRRMKHGRAKRTLQGIVQTSEEKIVECWLRDVAKMSAFPIDSRVREVLKRRRIPEDSDLIVEIAERLKVPVREFARAVYDNAKKL